MEASESRDVLRPCPLVTARAVFAPMRRIKSGETGERHAAFVSNGFLEPLRAALFFRWARIQYHKYEVSHCAEVFSKLMLAERRNSNMIGKIAVVAVVVAAVGAVAVAAKKRK